ncbi:MAG: C40 family peptidase [Calditrichaceae bacterium]
MVKYVHAVLIFILLNACVSTSRMSRNHVTGDSNDPVRQRLIDVSAGWMSVPYGYGGTDRNGVDCSGLVKQIFNEAFQLDLPRTTDELYESGQFVRDPWILPGDLLFFKNIRGRGVDHVGIYLGEGEFIHASSQQGVIISDFNTPYYKNHYSGARRYLFSSSK